MTEVTPYCDAYTSFVKRRRVRQVATNNTVLSAGSVQDVRDQRTAGPSLSIFRYCSVFTKLEPSQKRRRCEQDKTQEHFRKEMYMRYTSEESAPATLYCDAYTSFYSVRRATTGSFLAAAPAGIKPLINVNVILITIIIIAELNGNAANVLIPVSAPRIALTPIEIR